MAILIAKADGTTEPYNLEKLVSSLMRSGAEHGLARDISRAVEAGLYSGVTTQEIYRHAFSKLREARRGAAARYSLKRAILEFGPSGFPFEAYISELFRAEGARTEIDQIIQGACVEHEVDVVVHNGGSIMYVEAKFHNELGTKSDLKVVLYVKARFDDIKDNVYDYGGNDRKVTDSWLVTNTKFSSTAIHYAECKNMTLIGWNYPEKNNLQDMIENEGLHPVTCLTTLSNDEKKQLLAGGVVLCSSIKERPQVLKDLLGSAFDADSVLNEINELK